jgi:hypothetical protein
VYSIRVLVLLRKEKLWQALWHSYLLWHWRWPLCCDTPCYKMLDENSFLSFSHSCASIYLGVSRSSSRPCIGSMSSCVLKHTTNTCWGCSWPLLGINSNLWTAREGDDLSFYCIVRYLARDNLWPLSPKWYQQLKHFCTCRAGEFVGLAGI